MRYLATVVLMSAFMAGQPLCSQPSGLKGAEIRRIAPPLIKKTRGYLIKQASVDDDRPITPEGRFWATNIPNTDLLLVYAEDGFFCGSGGCSLQVLRRRGSFFHDIGGGQVIFPPITMLPRRHHGLPDLGVICRIGTVWQRQCAAKFTGKEYWVDWDRPIKADIVHPKGRLLLTDTDEGLPILAQAGPLKPGFTCVRKQPGQGHPADPLFGFQMPVCPGSMFKGKAAKR